MQITDNRQPTTAEVIQRAEKDSYQTDIYDYLGEEDDKKQDCTTENWGLGNQKGGVQATILQKWLPQKCEDVSI